MIERLTASDHDGALLAANAILRVDPKLPDALQAAQVAKAALYRLYDERLGPRDRVVTVTVPIEDLRFHALDAHSALLLTQVDGSRTIEDIIHSGILPKLDALRILSELFLSGLIGFPHDGV